MLPQTTDILIVGAGPTGLTLASRLAGLGIDCVLIDRLAVRPDTSRAAVVHARTLEVLQALGVADRLVGAGVPVPRFTIRDRDRLLMTVLFSGLPTAFPYTLMIPQNEIEAILEARLSELGGTLHRGVEVVNLVQDMDGVTATVSGGRTIRARYVAGADGMHSVVRDRAGIGFEGGSYEQSFVLADVHLDWRLESDEVVLFFSPDGLVVVAPLPHGRHRIVATADVAPERPGLADMQAILDTRGPRQPRSVVKSIVWSSRFHVHHRVATRYHAGHMVLAGDAAHVHSPAGGQGMNTSIQDAALLAERLRDALLRGPGLLDDYERQRRPVALGVVRLTDRLTRLATLKNGIGQAARNAAIRTFNHVPAFKRRLATRLAEIDIR